MFRLSTALAFVLVSLVARAAPPPIVVWGIDGAQGNSAATLYRIDPATGAATAVGPVGVGVTGLATDPTTGILYGATNGTSAVPADDMRRLVTIERTTGLATDVGVFNPVAKINDITFGATGQLFGWWGEGQRDLVAINKATGSHTVVGDSGLASAFGNGLAFCGSTLYLVPQDPHGGSLYTLDPASGAATVSATMTGATFAGIAVSALACAVDGTLFGSQLGVNGGEGQGEAHLITLAPPPGTVHDLGEIKPALGHLAIDALAIDQVSLDPPVATPPAPGIGVSVSLSATAKATGPVTFTWDFGDGGTATGATVMHAFAAKSVFTVTVTADAPGPVQDVATVDVPVAGATTTTTLPGTQPLALEKARVALNFAKPGRDAINLKGSFTPPAGFAVANQTVSIDVGGVQAQATLSRRGRSKAMQLRANGRFRVHLAHGSFAAALADDGLTNETVTGRVVSVPVSIVVGGVPYAAMRALTYTAKAGKKGTAK